MEIPYLMMGVLTYAKWSADMRVLVYQRVVMTHAPSLVVTENWLVMRPVMMITQFLEMDAATHVLLKTDICALRQAFVAFLHVAKSVVTARELATKNAMMTILLIQMGARHSAQSNLIVAIRALGAIRVRRIRVPPPLVVTGFWLVMRSVTMETRLLEMAVV